jgi:hypothetical protein
MLFGNYPYNTQNHCKKSVCKNRIKDSVLKKYLPTITKSPLNRSSCNKSLTDSLDHIPQKVISISNNQSFCNYLHPILLSGYSRVSRATNRKSIRKVEIAFLLLKREFKLIANSYNTKEQIEVLNYENTIMNDKLVKLQHLLSQVIDNYTNVKTQLHNAYRVLYNTEIKYQEVLKRFEESSTNEVKCDSVLKDISKMQIELGIVSNEIERTEKILKQKEGIIESNTMKYSTLKNNYEKLVESSRKHEELVQVKERNKVKLSLVKTRYNLTKGEYMKRVSNLVLKKSLLLSSIQMHNMYFAYILLVSSINKRTDFIPYQKSLEHCRK